MIVLTLTFIFKCYIILMNKEQVWDYFEEFQMIIFL